MKIIFLDIDGVLNSRQFLENRTEEIKIDHVPDFMANMLDRRALDHLKTIVEETGSKIVISSTWRIGRKPEWFIRVFEHISDFKFPIIGTTPLLDDKIRGEEIKHWLENSSDVERFVIVDDDSDFLEEQKQFFVQTSFKTGLTSKERDAIIELLNK